jgi:hypothetical protein
LPTGERRTVHDYFEAAYRGLGARSSAKGKPGPVVFGPDGLRAEFSVGVDASRVRTVSYRCTTCVTLVAMCEHLTELVSGLAISEANRWTAEGLLALHPEIPAERRERAHLAVAAFHAALSNSTKEKNNESGVHFFDAGAHRVLQTGQNDSSAA